MPANSTPKRERTPSELLPTPSADGSPSQRITRSMGTTPFPETTPPVKSRSRSRSRARTSPYFPSPSPSPSKRRAARVPADLSPYVLAQQLRPAVPLHPIERQPHHYGLLQELMQPDPWKLIIAVCLLNQTSGRAVRPILWQLLDRYPTPSALADGAPIDTYTRRTDLVDSRRDGADRRPLSDRAVPHPSQATESHVSDVYRAAARGRRRAYE
jgi:hypothetical protein